MSVRISYIWELKKFLLNVEGLQIRVKTFMSEQVNLNVFWECFFKSGFCIYFLVYSFYIGCSRKKLDFFF